eukprot:2488211-Lingulodinium_polyedra.AAC.1
MASCPLSSGKSSHPATCLSGRPAGAPPPSALRAHGRRRGEPPRAAWHVPRSAPAAADASGCRPAGR